MSRKVVLYISMSLDGYIASKNDDLSWLSIVESENEDYGYKAFNESVDTYIVGRKTYDIVPSLAGGDFPQAKDLDCYILTRNERKSENGVTFYNGEIAQLINDLKEKPGKDIYCDGGAEIVRLLMQDDLIDEYIISVIPILLGDGKRLFLGETSMLNLKALPSKQYKSGLVQLRYSRIESKHSDS